MAEQLDGRMTKTSSSMEGANKGIRAQNHCNNGTKLLCGPKKAVMMKQDVAWHQTTM